MALPALIAGLSLLAATGGYAAESYAEGKLRKAKGRYAAKKGYNRARSEAILREQEQAGRDVDEIKMRELGDDELWGLLTAVMTGTGGAAAPMATDMGSKGQLEASLNAAAGSPMFASRVRTGAEAPGNPILSAFGLTQSMGRAVA